ncbi:MAG: hypothetical protein CL561_07565 [Alphaproteobacteria bacterium]|nr:hypothetical protein [Alphaproteobacteria bacterium]|tara:strand:- start:6909 stop:7445 length:537 start_codon:yes stop_codon:yes gene_type:complete
MTVLQHKKVTAAQDFKEASAPYVDDYKLRLRTNCYSYALGLTDHGKGFPGRLSHNPETSPRSLSKQDMTVERIYKLLTEGDGLIPVEKSELNNFADHRLIAAFVQSHDDSHFMTRHRDGTWSHQDGHGGPISDEDDYGFKITNPEGAILRGYDSFVGYFAVPKAGLSYYTDPHKDLVY